MDLDTRLRKGPLRVRALWDEEQTALLSERVLARRRRRVVARVGAAAAVAAVAAMTLAILGREGSGPGGAVARPFGDSTEPASVPERATQGPSVAGSQSPRDRALVLSDGSRVELLGEATEVSLERDSPREAHATLHTGEAAFAVVPNARRVFELNAGPVRVRVLGTRFVVQLRGARARVAVTRGSVEVRWGSDATRVLTAGEAQWFPPAEAERAARPAAPAASSLASNTPAEGSRDWRQLAQRGDYRAAYRKLRTLPIRRRNTPADLMLAADIARRSGNHAKAVAPLRRVLSRHPHDPRAPLAAFTLGRVLAEELGRHAAAGDAFADARRLAPDGALAADALAREIEARKDAGETARARSLAGEYLELYPAGRHAPRYERLRSTR